MWFFKKLFNRPARSCFAEGTYSLPIGNGVSSNRINVNIFRHNGITSYTDEGGGLHVFACLVDSDGRVNIYQDFRGIVTSKTVFEGAVTNDAHNSPVIAVDGRGRIHCIIPFHNRKAVYMVSKEGLEDAYCRQSLPFSDSFSLTYPELYCLPCGDLVMTVRNGKSGNGDIHIAKFNCEKGRWTAIPHPVISGSGICSPYIQCCTDSKGRFHISWCWRDTSDVATNHDIMYIRSTDRSLESFTNSLGEQCSLPVTPDLSPIIQDIPTGSMLINQTTMCTDDDDVPYISSYWREGDVIQYHILKLDGATWKKYILPIRRTDFGDSGVGTRRLPIARPFVLCYGDKLYLLIRDNERKNRLCLVTMDKEDPAEGFKLKYLSKMRMGTYEPVADPTTMKKDHKVRMLTGVTAYSTDNREIDISKGHFYILTFDPDGI